MANSKISALTSATTPLAGTETLPIVQSGATVKASIANVQAAPVSAGTANGVQYLNGSKVPTTGTALQFDGANLGVSVVPSAWSTTFRAVQTGAGASVFGHQTTLSEAYLGSNFYFNSGNKFIGTGYAALYAHSAGVHYWYTSTASGTAGSAITFTQAATLTVTGVYLVGLTSATGVAKLQVSGAIRTTGFTVATLPAGTVGMRTYVTDALAPTFGAAVAGGGAVTIPVFYNGANWIVA